MTDDVRIDAASAAYRGFLFSDMRGFTAFAERHGNTAAAEMVARFLDIARSAIAKHEGAEVKTEGDAIHAVFPSASSAVMCGIDIVDAAAALNERQPDRPLELGVGIHAGEAIETAEGYIGRAVNIAARLCAAARPGEVLVSSTVKGIAHASIPVGFIPRGRRRLKGIADPIVVYAVTRDVNARAPRELPRPVLLGAAAALAVLLVAAAVIAGSMLLGNAGGSPAPSGAVAQPVVLGPLQVGRYATQQLEPAFTFDIQDLGWTAHRDQPGLFGLIRETSPSGSLYVAQVRAVIQDPCVEGAEDATGPSVGEVIPLLEALDHLVVSAPEAILIGGLPAQQVDVSVEEGALAACGGLVGADAAVFVVGDETWRATPGERFRLYSLQVGEDVVTILLSSDWTQTQSVQEHEALLDLGRRVLDTLRFDAPPEASPAP